jgi:hypothetical protein
MIAGISIWAASQQLMGKAGLKVMLLFFVFFGFLGVAAVWRLLGPRQRTKQQQSELLSNFPESGKRKRMHLYGPKTTLQKR